MSEENKASLYRKVFGTDSGRIVLSDLMETFDGMGNTPTDDARKAERFAGHRDVMLYILESLGVLYSYREIVRAFLNVPAQQPTERQKEAETNAIE